MRRLETFLLSAAALGAQITWTRIFSFMVWYHFAFLVISIAMLGFTSGGLLLNLRPTLRSRPRDPLLASTSLAFAFSTGLGLLCVLHLPFDGGILESAENLGLFCLLVILAGAEFFFAGLFIAFVLAAEPKRIAGLYFANMAGSGAGSALAVVLLDTMMPTTALLSFALLALIPTLLLVWKMSDRASVARWTALTGVLLATGWVASLDPLAEPFYLTSTKDFPGLKKSQIVERTSNSYAVLDFFEDARITGLWGASLDTYARHHPGRALPQRVGYCIDSWALTFAYDTEGDITAHPVFDYLPSAIGYAVTSPKEALIIGAGGGIDVITALRNGVEKVTAVELNPAIADAGRGYLSRFNQGIFHRPEVDLVTSEGRSFLTRSGDRRWDMIQLSGVDTLAAGHAGAFALSENFLYTTEAFVTYLKHVRDGGIVTLTRWMYEPPRQTLRALVLADAALRRMGIEKTADHIVLVRSSVARFSVLLMSPTPFTPEHSRRVLELSEARGLIPLVVPNVRIALPRENLHQEFVHTEDKAAFVEDYPFDVSATTDDKPFFMEHSRWFEWTRAESRDFGESQGRLLLLVTTVIVALFGLLFILVPARLIRRRDPRGDGRARALAYFCCLGLAYVMIEIVLVQKLTLFLGNPSLSLAVVLCALLVFSGLGSMVSERFLPTSTRRSAWACVAATTAILASHLTVDPLFDATLHLALGDRIAIVLGVLAIPAALMGMPFPIAVATFADRPDLIVGGWVVNGYCSVVASCIGMIVSITFGFGAVLLAGAGIYAIAALAAPTTRHAPDAHVATLA